MKLTYAALVPFATAFFATTVLAYPVNGYKPTDLNLRELTPEVSLQIARAFDEEELYDRNLFSNVVKAAKKFKSTPEEKERRKAFKQGHKQYVATGKDIAATAKKELGKDYNVKTNFVGPGYAEHGAKAHEVVNKGWHNTKNLQQYRHADINVNVLPSGRKHVTAKFHNGPAGSIPQASTQFLYD